jgi:UDP-N-acetylmuramate--alanine ligase
MQRNESLISAWRRWVREFVQHIHFVGIGGAGMSGIASVLLDQGYKVSGSDSVDSAAVQRLAKQGARACIGHAEKQIEAADVVVVSSAISNDNPELVAAHSKGIPVIPRAEMLGELMRFRQGIAVAGTHGKTTTTSLIANILALGGLDPTFVVGGLVNSVQGNARLGSGDFLVAEADESDGSFLRLHPCVAVITNIDADHMDTYDGDFNRLVEAFLEFLHNLPFYGLAVLSADDPVLQELRGRLQKPSITYGFQKDADYRASDVQQVGPRTRFRAHRPQGESIPIDLALPGTHNVQNALAAVAISDKLGVASDCVAKGLSSFEGIGRRFEILGRLPCQNGSVVMVDDYAHHPREVAVTLDAARACWPHQDLLVVFQPHRYSRTRDLFDDFVELLASETRLLVCEVYPAGETPIAGADGLSLCHAIRGRGRTNPVFVENVLDLAEILPSLLRPDDVLLTLGAGNIGRVARELIERLNGWPVGSDQ